MTVQSSTLSKLRSSKASKPSPPSASDAKNCFHCSDAIPSFSNIHSVVDGKQREFCCHGCQAAADFIQTNDLAAFYQRRELDRDLDRDKGFAVEANSQRAVKNDWSFLDDPDLAMNFVSKLDNGDRTLKLNLSGLYCSSCGWLIDQTLKKYAVTITTKIDVDAKCIYLRFSESEVLISKALQRIEKLGYIPTAIKLDDSSDLFAQQHTQQARNSLKRITVAGFGMMQVMTYAVALYFGDYQGMDESFRRFLSLVSMLVATFVVFYSGKPFFANAWRDLRNYHLGMDVPIAIAIGSAYWLSVYQILFRGEGHVFFDSAVMFVFFLSVGRHVEMRARHRLSSAPTALRAMLPPFIEITRQVDSQATMLTIQPQDVCLDDVISLDQRRLIPFDGVIIDGTALVDEATITGESKPVQRQTGDLLKAGCVLVQGDLKLRATATWANSSMAKIEQILSQAQTSSQSQASEAQNLAQYFILTILLITAVVGATWWFIAPERVFQIVLAMLVASCPCAFSLAAPVASAAASRKLRQHGLLLANFDALNMLPKLTTWCFDKTGTITRGTPKISNVELYGSASAKECVAIAAALEVNNMHILSSAFTALSNANAAASPTASNLQSYAGKGVTACIDEQPYYLGKPSWVLAQLADYDQNLLKQLNQSNITVVTLANAEQLLAVFSIEDQLRPRLSKTLQYLQGLNTRLTMLSGDRLSVCQHIAKSLPIDTIAGDLSAEQKMQHVRDLQARGEVVAMVGDGVNDALVLAQADLKIAMAQGSELSHSQADIIILNGRLSSLELLYKVAAKAKNVTQQNRLWAISYNLIVLPLAAAGLLTPWMAALGMSISSLFVVLNALRIVQPSTRVKIDSTAKLRAIG